MKCHILLAYTLWITLWKLTDFNDYCYLTSWENFTSTAHRFAKWLPFLRQSVVVETKLCACIMCYSCRFPKPLGLFKLFAVWSTAMLVSSILTISAVLLRSLFYSVLCYQIHLFYIFLLDSSDLQCRSHCQYWNSSTDAEPHKIIF